jgi:hypothetical protein
MARNSGDARPGIGRKTRSKRVDILEIYQRFS